jgi:hypothetical protein
MTTKGIWLLTRTAGFVTAWRNDGFVMARLLLCFCAVQLLDSNAHAVEGLTSVLV